MSSDAEIPDDLGQLRGEFRPGSGGVTAGLLLGAIGLGGGLLVLILAVGGHVLGMADESFARGGLVGGAVALGLGLLYLRHVRELLRIRLRVFDEGLVEAGPRGCLVFRWDAIADIEDSMPEPAAELEEMEPARTLILTRRDGEKLFLASGTVRRSGQLRRLILDELARRSIPGAPGPERTAP